MDRYTDPPPPGISRVLLRAAGDARAKQKETGVNKSIFHANSILFIREEKLLLSKTYNLLNKRNRLG